MVSAGLCGVSRGLPRVVTLYACDADLLGLRTQTQNAAFFERKGPERKPWPRGKPLKTQKRIAMRLLNANVLPRKSLSRSLSWGFPFGNLLPETQALEHCVLERKREPKEYASALGTLRFRTLRTLGNCWEVLNGVGVDGVGVILPFFTHFCAFLRIFFVFFFAFLRFSSLFSSSPKG